MPLVSRNNSVPFSKLSATAPHKVASRSTAGVSRRVVSPTAASQGVFPLPHERQ